MTLRLTVHIGAIKTGSSAIQMFLNRNVDTLRGCGIVIPDDHMELNAPVTGDQVFFFDRLRDRASTEARKALSDRLERLFSGDNVRQVVISAENLSEPTGHFAPWFEQVTDVYDTEVVVYLRRQDDLLISAWQQWYAKVSEDIWDDFSSWLLSCVGILGNWEEVLRRWEEAVGRERLRVRLYEPRHLIDGDAVSDFRQFLLVGDDQELTMASQRVNASFSEAVVDLVPGSGLFRDAHDDAFYLFLEWMLGDAVHRRRDESPLSFRERLAILTRYAECNKWVRATYFENADVPDTLFEMPRPEEYRTATREELTREQLQLVSRLVFELGKDMFRMQTAETESERRWW